MNILSVSYDQLHKFRYFFGSREVLISDGQREPPGLQRHQWVTVIRIVCFGFDFGVGFDIGFVGLLKSLFLVEQTIFQLRV
jgi:hypothetical protein